MEESVGVHLVEVASESYPVVVRSGHAHHRKSRRSSSGMAVQVGIVVNSHCTATLPDDSALASRDDWGLVDLDLYLSDLDKNQEPVAVRELHIVVYLEDILAHLGDLGDHPCPSASYLGITHAPEQTPVLETRQA